MILASALSDYNIAETAERIMNFFDVIRAENRLKVKLALHRLFLLLVLSSSYYHCFRFGGSTRMRIGFKDMFKEDYY